jgi:dUTP pyrophosphatase
MDGVVMSHYQNCYDFDEQARKPIIGFDQMTTRQAIIVKHLGPAPYHGSEQASGFDLVCADTIWMASLDTMIVKTGLSIQLPAGYEAQVRPRSSVSRDGWLVHFGTIDADYRGEIGVIVTNVGRNYRPLDAGRRIAQLCFCQVPSVTWQAAESLDETERGERGFGSTGK